MTMRGEVKGGRHNIYLVSLTDNPYTYVKRRRRSKKKEGYMLFLSIIASISCKASRNCMYTTSLSV
jgi:hypothetical protein